MLNAIILKDWIYQISFDVTSQVLDITFWIVSTVKINLLWAMCLIIELKLLMSKMQNHRMTRKGCLKKKNNLEHRNKQIQQKQWESSVFFWRDHSGGPMTSQGATWTLCMQCIVQVHLNSDLGCDFPLLILPGSPTCENGQILARYNSV